MLTAVGLDRWINVQINIITVYYGRANFIKHLVLNNWLNIIISPSCQMVHFIICII